MEENDFCKLNMEDRDRIRRKVIEALKKSGYDEGSMKQDGILRAFHGRGRTRDTDRGPRLSGQEAGTPGQVREGQHGDPGKGPPLSLARLLAETPIPFSIVATEKEAVVFDTITGNHEDGYGTFPTPKEAEQRLRDSYGVRIPSAQREGEAHPSHLLPPTMYNRNGTFAPTT